LDWEEEYHNPNVLDGTQRDLEIDYGDQNIKYYSSDLYLGATDLDWNETPGSKPFYMLLGYC